VRRMRRFVVVGAYVAFAVLVTAGCASSGPTSTPASTSGQVTTRTALVSAVKTYGRNLGQGKADAAYAELSKRCRDSISLNDYRSTAAQLKPLLKGGNISKVTVTAFAPRLPA
jgi:hypothetical protein